MKRFLACLICFVVILGGCFLIDKGGKDAPDILRVHIRANSNSQSDQSVKFLVKDKVTAFLQEGLLEIDDIDKAIAFAKSSKKNIDKIADEVLKSNGYDYKCNSKIGIENFPTRIYEGITFEGGNYNCLVLELGEAQGDNWWCVMYPPLCFLPYDMSDNQKFEYKSFIKQLLQKSK